MKNKLIIFFLLITGSVTAQTYSKRFLISSNIVFSGATGSHVMTYNNASFIKLFPNIKSLTGGRFGLTYLFTDHIGAGVSYSYNSMKGWKYELNEGYSLSEGSLSFISPTLFIQSGNLFNGRFRVYSQAGPILSVVNVKLMKTAVFVYDLAGKRLFESQSTYNINPGFNFTTGMYYSVNETINFSLALSCNYFTTSSVIYPDTSVNLISVEAGVIFKIFKDKRYYY